MGYYIETKEPRGKAQQLIVAYGATEIPEPKHFSEVPAGKALVCVVANGLFDAAGYCYDASEFRDFTDPDDVRPKRWLLMDEPLVQELSHFNRRS